MLVTVARNLPARPYPLEPVRTLDAVHLSTALLFAWSSQDLRMTSFDGRIAQNAEALGLA